jgi:hypothetical protein
LKLLNVYGVFFGMIILTYIAIAIFFTSSGFFFGTAWTAIHTDAAAVDRSDALPPARVLLPALSRGAMLSLQSGWARSYRGPIAHCAYPRWTSADVSEVRARISR